MSKKMNVFSLPLNWSLSWSFSVTRHFALIALLSTAFSSGQVFAYTQPCQLVQKMAGFESYKLQPLRVASMKAPEDLPAGIKLTLLERHGAWYVYQTPEPWYGTQECAPLKKQSIEFMPVMLNRQTGHNAVLTGSFILKVHRARDLETVIERYGVSLVTYLPKADSAIVDVRPIKSYDELILRMDIDKDVQLLAPLFSEPRMRRK